MAKTREIKGRMKAVGNIERITKTMQMIATARFNAAQRRATASQPYTRKIAQLVGELAGAGDSEALDHPLLKKPDPAAGKQLVLVLTSDRGLCGGYNANILRRANKLLEAIEEDEEEARLEVVGKKGRAFFQFQETPIDQYHSQFGDKPAYEDVEQLAERLIDEFTEGAYDAVHVVYMAFESMGRQTPEALRLLPLDRPESDEEEADAGGEAVVDYEYMPDPAQLLAELLPITVKTQLFQCFNEAVVSEQIARMVAMKAATDAAGKMKKSLNREFNRARQAAITTELTEIVGGAAALE
ncbi:MAG: ATP synthase F1 subunit gamma [Phycisphaeraceae bacterium]|nr:ATP synthase F1 subunit gamma [Phycisphaeraceae bacterium]